MIVHQPTCSDCGAVGPMYAGKSHAAAAAAQHICDRACRHCGWGRAQATYRGLCCRCYADLDIRLDYPVTIHRADDLIEDVEWLLDDGVNLTQALARLDITNDALWKALDRRGRRDLFDRLADREPDGETRRKTREAVRASKAKQKGEAA